MTEIFKPADILLPKKKYDMTRWSVIACDQYTSDPEYWADVKRIVSDSPSAFNLILPEVYLGTEEEKNILGHIKEKSLEYMNEDVFDEYKDSFIYVRRVDSTGRVRDGIVGAIDLEAYDYSKGSKSPVRATEETVAERIPPRVKIRENAVFELPHIMILIDDLDKKVIESLNDRKDSFEKVYDFKLMKGGGSIAGWVVDDTSKNVIQKALEELKAKAKEVNKDENPLVFAMGDGNHSLATAKAHYENLKKKDPTGERTKLARYALAEIVNLHCDALEFEAIHRIVEDVDTENLMAFLKEKLGLQPTTYSTYEENAQVIFASTKDAEATYRITKPCHSLAVGSLQMALDEYLSSHNGKIDYIHGKSETIRLSKKENAIAFVLPDMKKEELFPAIMKGGVLPRKTFSMGHAEDKRYYLEARRINN
ncbi:MAG: DUF1015 domain-containing protein [Lachnospiraceae bacterium]|nr:DUF1015 domain-containing protein [Lachnospiraceae bacterium]